MLNDRRKFIVATGMLAGGALIPGFGAVIPTAFTSRGRVLDLISRYGNQIGEPIEQGDVLKLTVRVRCRESYAGVYTDQSRHSLELVRSLPGNELQLVCQGRKFLITHLS